jgi:hypothetical protein
MSNKTCGECRYFEPDDISAYCEVVKIICDDKAPACKAFEPKPTVFQQITESPEVLAEKLVYCVFNAWGESHWKSTVIGEKKFPTLTKAIAATVAKLKEVAE